MISDKVKSYIIYGLLLAVAILIGRDVILESDLKVETAMKEKIISALSFQSAMIDINRVDYEHNLQTAAQRRSVVQVEYRDRVQYIYQWKKEDNNVTCDDLIDAIDSYQY